MLCESPISEALGPVDTLSLFLDFDGTLVSLAERPEAIRVAPGLPDLLERASARLDGRLMLVSGRTIADLDIHLGSHDIAISGSHGFERRLPGGAHEEMARPADLPALTAAAQAGVQGHRGVMIEQKRFGIALHYRQEPGAEGEVQVLAARLATEFGLALKHGKMVAELMPAGHDKGSAVAAAMARDDFAATRPVFIGDDVTDEDGFRAAAALGGHGILVGDREGSEARYRLPDPAAVHALLERLIEGTP